jgi:molybdenum cofactor cytidylyltransferase
MNNLHIVLIAAGSSKRMGRQKQLLPWGKQNLLEHQIYMLSQTGLSLSVILGANVNEIKSRSDLSQTTVHIFPEWKLGMGASIAFGIGEVLKNNSRLQGIVIALADQPLIQVSHYLRMKAAFEPGKKQLIVSESKTGYWSAPVLFDRFYFPQLQQLNGDKGAMPLVRKNEQRVKLVLCETSLKDIDTPKDYQDALQEFKFSP